MTRVEFLDRWINLLNSTDPVLQTTRALRQIVDGQERFCSLGLIVNDLLDYYNLRWFDSSKDVYLDSQYTYNESWVFTLDNTSVVSADLPPCITQDVKLDPKVYLPLTDVLKVKSDIPVPDRYFELRNGNPYVSVAHLNDFGFSYQNIADSLTSLLQRARRIERSLS